MRSWRVEKELSRANPQKEISGFFFSSTFKITQNYYFAAYVAA